MKGFMERKSIIMITASTLPPGTMILGAQSNTLHCTAEGQYEGNHLHRQFMPSQGVTAGN